MQAVFPDQEPLSRIFWLALAARRSPPLPRQRCPSRSPQKEGPIQAPNEICHRTALHQETTVMLLQRIGHRIKSLILPCIALVVRRRVSPHDSNGHILTCATKQRSKSSPSFESLSLRGVSTVLRMTQARSNSSRGCSVRHAEEHVKRSEQKPYRRKRLTLTDDTSFAPRTPASARYEWPGAKVLCPEDVAISGRSHPRQTAISGLPRRNFHLIYVWETYEGKPYTS